MLLAKPESTRYILLGAMLIGAHDRCDRPGCSASGGWRSSSGRAARSPRCDDGFRRPEGGRRPRPPRRRGRDRERDRAERRREDDAVQPHHRRLRAAGRRHRVRGQEHRRASTRTRSRNAASHGRSRRCACSSTCRFARTSWPPRTGTRSAGVFRSMLRTPGMRREEREIRALAETAPRLLRRAADGLSLGSARLQPLVRQPPAARDRACDRHQPAAAAAGRAGRRDEPEGDAGDHRADRPAAHRGAASRSSSSSTTCTSWRASRTGWSPSTTA